MKKYLVPLLVTSLLGFSSTDIMADPKEDLKNFRSHFNKKFPGVTDVDFTNGAYGLDEKKRIQWDAMEEFPPYEEFVEKGEEIWNTPFKNGKSFASCLGDDPAQVRTQYPHWDKEKSTVATLESSINECLRINGEKEFKLKKGAIAYLGAYLGYEGRGQKTNVVIPDDPKALAAFNDGKQNYYAKRGMLNLACADCHAYAPGQYVRGNLLSTGLGHTTHFPVFRGKWANKSGGGWYGYITQTFWWLF